MDLAPILPLHGKVKCISMSSNYGWPFLFILYSRMLQGYPFCPPHFLFSFLLFLLSLVFIIVVAFTVPKICAPEYCRQVPFWLPPRRTFFASLLLACLVRAGAIRLRSRLSRRKLALCPGKRAVPLDLAFLFGISHTKWSRQCCKFIKSMGKSADCEQISCYCVTHVSWDLLFGGELVPLNILI